MNLAQNISGALMVSLLSVGQACGQGTTQVRFEGPPYLRPGTAIHLGTYDELGVWFYPILGTDGFVRCAMAIDSRDPDNGSAYLQATMGDSLMFGLDDGSTFGLTSVDLAEYSTVVPDAVTVPFVGYHSDGSTVTGSFTTDGIMDGTGPLADFQTFYFGPEFTDLQYVKIPAYGWSLDNLVISIPEPSPISFLLAGAALLLFRLRTDKP